MDFMYFLHTFRDLIIAWILICIFIHFDAMDALKITFLLQFYTFRCSSFGACKSHDLSSGTSMHVRVIVDSMGLGEGYLTYLDLKLKQPISTFINWHGADLICNLDKACILWASALAGIRTVCCTADQDKICAHGP